ncbi:hypothetical protein PF005_g7296 [Phytophthora fragariae]|uniref:Uncharacterized protein n=1 Tax=Phytophthora fragariae TaxID=53985 RepID=A0A6A3FYW6_9STRA|nr:hypothetical protein PF003_g27177 [Phytophthora fragariae]KAE8949661.1 hypothetical protein PF009_g824 [Phytophthora fragariae]KAE9018010.1 hypothetical protein PF011_g6445 [Phytophthora fragariae]KAE9121338.1 hypothetical protein PF007_g7842 [Phytophthora fragariae]KAE9124312.1 hypothetical protein PF010_g6049 [Phytophthora fragariae]
MDSVSSKLWTSVTANADELDLVSLCGNPADWAGAIVRKNVEKLDDDCILELCGNPAAWAGKLIKPKLDVYSKINFNGRKLDLCEFIEPACHELKVDGPRLVKLCGNPGDWAGEIVTKVRTTSKGVGNDKLTAECNAALCGNSAEWAKETVFEMASQLTLTSSCVAAACGNPSAWVRTIVLKGIRVGSYNARCGEVLCANEAEWASTVIRHNAICRERYLKKLCTNPAPWAKEAVDNLHHIITRNHIRDLCENSGEWAREILTRELKRDNETKEDWIAPLCGNSAEWTGIMVDLLCDNPNWLDFHRLSKNPGLWAIQKLVEYSDKIDFQALSTNRFPVKPSLDEPEAELDCTSNETSATSKAYQMIVAYNAIEKKLLVGYFGSAPKPRKKTFKLLDAAICNNPKVAEGILRQDPLTKLHALREERTCLIHAVKLSVDGGISISEAEVGSDNDEDNKDVDSAERCRGLEEEATELRSTISDWERTLASLVVEIGRKKEAEAANRIHLEQVRVLMDEEAEEERDFLELQEEAESQQRKIREDMEGKRLQLEQNRAARRAKVTDPTAESVDKRQKAVQF